MGEKRVSRARTRGRLVLASYGLNDRQMTLETLVALHECDAIYSDALTAGTKRSLERTFGPGCSRIKLLTDLSREGIERFLAAQVEKGRVVAFLTYGDPTILSTCGALIDLCEKGNIDYRVYPAISYLNVLLGELRLASAGSAGVLLTWVGTEVSGFNARVPALVFLFGTKSHAKCADSLIGDIRRAYPREHQVEVLSYFVSDGGGLRRNRYRIEDLKRAWDEADNQSTLYIPAVAMSRGFDRGHK